MAITPVGNAKSPTTENAANVGPTATVTPPGGLQSGDYVVVLAGYRGTSVTLAVGTTGGQTWTSETAQTQSTTNTSRLFHCRFNGTWSADPTFTVTSGTNAIIAYMTAWRGVHGTTALDLAIAQAGYAAPSTPFDVARAGLTTVTDKAVVLYFWLSSDNNTWAMQTAGLDQIEAMWRVTTTTGLAISLGYMTQWTAGASGSFTNRQTALGGDAGTTHVLALRPATITTILEDRKRIGIGIWRPVPTAQTRRR